jgi:hypothetical protein
MSQVLAQEKPQPRKADAAKPAIKPEAKVGSGCPHCGAALDAAYEFCPVCGHKLVDYCTFCGAHMDPQDIDCPECGMPADGVQCPTCGKRGLRAFCGQCGQPLSRAARAAVDKAKKDPAVQRTARLIMQIAELEAELETAEVPEDQAPREPTETEKRYRELMAKVGFTPASIPQPSKRSVGRSRAEIMAEYEKAVKEAEKLLEEMLPPAGMTPQEQRNYYTARKVAMMEVMEERWWGIKVTETMGWVCNECNVLHNNPSECCVAEFGGHWVTCDSMQVVEEGTEGAELCITRVEKKVYKRQ